MKVFVGQQIPGCGSISHVDCEHASKHVHQLRAKGCLFDRSVFAVHDSSAHLLVVETFECVIKLRRIASKPHLEQRKPTCICDTWLTVSA
eukprot:6211751-Pleurochrysis_carterae.AAC.1